MKLRCLVLAFAVVLAGCQEEKPPVPVVVGAKSTTEQRLLGEIVAQVLEDWDMVVERKFDLGGTAQIDEALRSGKIDVYVEYSGLALIQIVRAQNAGETFRAGANAVLQKLKTTYEPAGLAWAAPLGFDNPYVLVVHGSTAATTITEAVPSAANWRAGLPIDFQQRSDLLPALQKTYGLKFAEVKTIEADKAYQALRERQVDVVLGQANDAAIAKLSLRALDDDRKVLPIFEAVPVVRRAALQDNPDIPQALNSLNEMLDSATMRRMNAAVEIDKRPVAEVAEEWVSNL